MKKLALISLLIVGCLIFWEMGKAEANIWILTDSNSSVSIDDGSQAGVYNWTVDGHNNLFQMQFWYRVGNNPELSTNPQSYINKCDTAWNEGC